MYETTVTLVGRLVAQLKQVRFDDGSILVNGRMACNERRLDRDTGQWVNGKTLFVSIVCRRGLAENAFISLRSGDPVIVHGRLYTREYVKDGVPRSLTELDAWSIGPDLRSCTAVLTKKSRSTAPASGEAGYSPPAGDASDESFWENDAHPDGRPETDDIPSDDPWAEAASMGSSTGEVAVGV